VRCVLGRLLGKRLERSALSADDAEYFGCRARSAAHRIGRALHVADHRRSDSLARCQVVRLAVMPRMRDDVADDVRPVFFRKFGRPTPVISRGKLKNIFLFSVFLVAAIASRPHFILVGFFLIPFVLIYLSRTVAKEKLIRSILALVGPMASGCLALGLYNFVRFGSWVEFGQNYMLTPLGINVQREVVAVPA